MKKVLTLRYILKRIKKSTGMTRKEAMATPILFCDSLEEELEASSISFDETTDAVFISLRLTNPGGS